MSPAPHPRMHGLTHVRGGPDPVPCCVDAGGATTYPDLVQAHPCLVHYWPANEGAGDLLDRVGNWDLVIDTTDVSGATYPQYGAAGPLTELPEYTAVVNSGVGGVGPADDGRFYYDFTSAPFWTLTAEFTIEMWAYLVSVDGATPRTLLQAGPVGGGTAITITIFPDDLTVSHGAVTVNDSVALPLAAWHHIVVRYDGSTLDLFRNGAEVDSDADGGATITGRLTWLNNGAGPSWSPWDGRAAHLALYDCALTDEEIAAHYAGQDLSGDVPDGYVLTADGEGGFDWEPPAEPPGPLLDTQVWMPLTTVTAGVPELVWDGDDQLIPTITSI